MDVEITRESESMYESIDNIHKFAFSGDYEAKLVRKLRDNSLFIKELSLVALRSTVQDANAQKDAIGHVLFFPIHIVESENKERVNQISLGLAPLAVLPEYQNKGIGKRLVTFGLEQAKQFNYKSVIVLGEYDYYKRFGFKPSIEYNIKSPFNCKENNFMVLELVSNCLDGLKTSNLLYTVQYPNEFF